MSAGRTNVLLAAALFALLASAVRAAEAPPEPDDREIPPNRGSYRLFEKDFRERLRNVKDPATPMKERLDCLSLFALTHDERAVPDLVKLALEERQPIDFRVAILWTLGEIGDPGGMRALQQALYKIYLKDPAWRHEGIPIEGQKEPISLQWLCESNLAHLAEATFEDKNKRVRSVTTLFIELLDNRAASGGTGPDAKNQPETEELGRLRAALITLAAVGDRDGRAVRALCNVLRADDKYYPWDFKVIAAQSLASLVDRRLRLFAAMKANDKMSASIADAFLEACIVTDIPEVRDMAGLLLRRMGRADSAAQTLAAVLARPVPKEVRYHAIETLAFLRSKEAAEALILQLYDRDGSIRWRAAVALGATGDPRAIDFLRKLTRDPDPLVRGRVVAALGHLEESRSLPDLIAAMSDTDARVRRQAALALGRVGTFRAVPALVRALKDPVPIVREHAIIALGSIRRATGLRPVAAMLQDPEPAVRLAAVEVLGRFDNALATKALTDALSDSDATVRDACARVFKDRLARDAKSTLPLLTETVAKSAGDARLAALKCVVEDYRAAQAQKQGSRASQYQEMLKDADGSLRLALVAALDDKLPQSRLLAGDWLAEYAWSHKDKALLERVAALADDADIKVRTIGLRARNYLRNLP
jgi:HEAT repeat protein